MRRRAFIAALGSALVRPTTGRAQRADRIKRIGILVEYGEADAEAQSRLDALSQGLRALGWSNGPNLQIERRFAAGEPETIVVFSEGTWFDRATGEEVQRPTHWMPLPAPLKDQ